MPQRTTLCFRRAIAIIVCATMFVGSFAVMPHAVHASNINNILSDDDLFDGLSMSAERVQSFLEAQGSFLASYRVNENGVSQRAADLIASVGKQYNISPKFFLTLLQKEQSLITDPSPSKNQIDYALGYGCPSTCSTAYRGFAKQLRSAADRIVNTYVPALKKNGSYGRLGIGPGRTSIMLDDVQITPANIATAILYIYNPYVGNRGGGDPRWGGNSLFQFLWQQWFVSIHPDGSLLRVQGEKAVWLIRNGQRLPFASRAAFDANYDMSKVIAVGRQELESYPIGPYIKYPEPSLLQLQDGSYVLLVNDTARPVASLSLVRNLGYMPEEVIRGVTLRDLSVYDQGAPVTKQDVFPSGRLLQSKQSGAISYIDSDGVRHPIYSKEVYRSQFRNQNPDHADDAVILAAPIGSPVVFRDGELIVSRTERKIYFVSNGRRRPIPDTNIFRELGFKMKNVIWTNDKSVQTLPLGDPLNDISLGR